jgi:hypothetical protein
MPDASERKTLITCAFLSGCILLGPGEFRAAVVPFGLALILYVWHRRVIAREARSGGQAAPRVPATVAILATAGGATGVSAADADAVAPSAPGEEAPTSSPELATERASSPELGGSSAP